VRACLTNAPDLVILDIRLPDIDGFEVASRLRGNRKTKEIPIIFLTEKRERGDRLRGLELQADDYITKPFDIQELRLRVRNTLQRSRQGSLTNPVTGIPEGSLVDEALNSSMERADTVLLVVSLKNLRRFHEVYGFVASDDLLRAISLMVRDVVRDHGTPEDFLGHLSPADFLIITRQAQATTLRERVRKRLEQSFDYFYSDQDREQGTFRDKQLSVQVHELPLSTLAERNLACLKAELELLCR
jgi:PleD family two-component response regulator